MLHISICDDERIAVEKMQRIVENVLEQEHLLVKLETFENGEEFLKQYVIRDDELVILDLDMPVKNGIDVLQELEKIQRNEVVILVTAYDNLALKTFSYGPFQIVRKEQMEEDLPKAIGRFLNIRKRNQEELEFRIKGELIHVKLEDIVYLKNINIRFMCIWRIRRFLPFGKICKILRKNWREKDLSEHMRHI